MEGKWPLDNTESSRARPYSEKPLHHPFSDDASPLRRQALSLRFPGCDIVMGNVELLDAGDLDQERGVGLDHQTMMTALVLGWKARRCASKGTARVNGFSGHWWQWSDTAGKMPHCRWFVLLFWKQPIWQLGLAGSPSFLVSSIQRGSSELNLAMQ